MPLKILVEPQPADVADVLGLTVSDIVFQTPRPTTATLGIQFTITEVRDRATLSAAKPNIEALRRFATKYPHAGRFAQHVYTRGDGVIFARMFDPLDNIAEEVDAKVVQVTIGGSALAVMEGQLL